ncbi:hypothetical protein BJX64DRAFT_259085 [Aspergillus heterothallicus]
MEARYFLRTCDAVLLTSSQDAVEHSKTISAALGIDSFTPSPSTEPSDAHFVLESKREFTVCNSSLCSRGRRLSHRTAHRRIDYCQV